MLAQRVHIEVANLPGHTRFRRDTPSGSFGDKVTIDSIGVPRGVPNEYKAHDQIAGGFTAGIPFFGPIIETSKNTEFYYILFYFITITFIITSNVS